MDVSVLRLFAPFLMASLSTCSVSAESKIMPPAQGLWERNRDRKKELSDTNFSWTVKWQYCTSGWPRPLSASQTPIRIIFTQERTRNKTNSHFVSVNGELAEFRLKPPCLINHTLIWHILESVLFSKLREMCNYRSWSRIPSTIKRSCTTSLGFDLPRVTLTCCSCVDTSRMLTAKNLQHFRRVLVFVSVLMQWLTVQKLTLYTPVQRKSLRYFTHSNKKKTLFQSVSSYS